MRFLLTLLALFVGAAYAESIVQSLTKDSFQEFINANPLVLVKMTAPWCGHCKSLAPNFEKAAEQLQGVAALADVDCTVEKELCEEYGVRGYPTVKVFQEGTVTEYKGGRQAADIVNYMKRQTEPVFTAVTLAELADLQAKDDTIIAAYIASDDKTSQVDFEFIAKELRNKYKFVTVTDDSAATKPSIKLFKSGEEVSPMSGEFTVENMKKYISAESFPLVGLIGPENYPEYMERGLPLVWCFIDFSNEEQTNSVIAAATAAAKTVKGQLSVVKLDGVQWAEHAKYYGLSGVAPGIVIENHAEGVNYLYPQDKEITEVDLTQFLQDYVAGTLEPNLKSEEIPETQDGPVYTLVGKSFHDIVHDETKDVFVEFYAPYCGHCKTLAPKYEQLAEMYAEDKTTLIAKIDATANDVPALKSQIRGFPTMMLFRATNKFEPLQFDGERTAEAMRDFINSHKTVGVQASSESESKDEGNDEL